jgi:hypothetical protein
MRWLTVCLCFLWVGCATTRIQVQDAQADIFMDGQNLGKGTAEISSIGPPHTANIEARKHGKRKIPRKGDRPRPPSHLSLEMDKPGTGLGFVSHPPK